MKSINNPRVVCLAFHTGNLDYSEPHTPDTEYIVDDSTFVPIAEAIKQLGNGSSTAAKTDLLYDFPDGKDNGQPIPFSRSSQFKDIAELSTEIKNQTDSIKSEVEKANKEAELMEQIKKDLAPDTPDTPEE